MFQTETTKDKKKTLKYRQEQNLIKMKYFIKL